MNSKLPKFGPIDTEILYPGIFRPYYEKHTKLTTQGPHIWNSVKEGYRISVFIGPNLGSLLFMFSANYNLFCSTFKIGVLF